MEIWNDETAEIDFEEETRDEPGASLVLQQLMRERLSRTR
jgi:hypothetical protein